MSFVYKGAYVGPFAVSVGSATDGQIQKFRYPVPIKKVKHHMPQGVFILSGRMHLSWSTGTESDLELGPGGSFVEDASDDRPLSLEEELTVRSLGNSSYLCVAPVGTEQRVRMQRIMLQPDSGVEVPRYDFAAVVESQYNVFLDNQKVPAGPRLFYGRNRSFELKSDGLVNCAIFTMEG